MSKVNHSHIYKKQGVLLHPQFLRPCKEDELELFPPRFELRSAQKNSPERVFFLFSEKA